MFRFRKFCPFQTRSSPVPPPDHDTNFLNYDSLDMSFLKLERTALHRADVPTTRPNTSRSRAIRLGSGFGRPVSVNCKKKKKNGKLVKKKKVP